MILWAWWAMIVLSIVMFVVLVVPHIVEAMAWLAICFESASNAHAHAKKLRKDARKRKVWPNVK